MDQNCFAETSTTEETNFSTFVKGDEEVDDFETGLEEFDFNVLLAKLGWFAVDGVGGSVGDLFATIDGLSEKVEYSTETFFADGDLDWSAGIDGSHTSDESVGGAEGDCAHHVVAEVEGDFDGEVDASFFVFNDERVVDFGKSFVGEAAVYDWSGNLHDGAMNRHNVLKSSLRRLIFLG